jgi:hypothetical protein
MKATGFLLSCSTKYCSPPALSSAARIISFNSRLILFRAPLGRPCRRQAHAFLWAQPSANDHLFSVGPFNAAIHARPRLFPRQHPHSCRLSRVASSLLRSRTSLGSFTFAVISALPHPRSSKHSAALTRAAAGSLPSCMIAARVWIASSVCCRASSLTCPTSFGIRPELTKRPEFTHKRGKDLSENP